MADGYGWGVFPMQGWSRTVRHRGGAAVTCSRSRLLAGAAVLALVATACGAATHVATRRSGASNPQKLPFMTFADCCQVTTWEYNPYGANFAGAAEPFVYLPLAIQVPPKISTWRPQLAKSWSVSGDKLTVHLRPGLTWQNGQPLTSKDVYDTVLLDGTNGGAQWDAISSLSDPSPTTVVFTIRRGVPAASAEYDVLGTYPYPSSVYGKFVTPALKKDDIAYYNELATNPGQADQSSAYKAISDDFQALAKLSVPKIIGDGPFRFITMNTLEAKLVKWNGFYDASKIHVGGIDYIQQQNQNTYPYMFSGRADWSSTFMPPSIVQKWLSTPDSHIAIAPSFGFAITFADSKYPLNITKVRQALAYVIPRKQMVSITYGTKDGDAKVEPHPDGLSPSIEPLWLTKSQIASLNTYPLDPSKAASMLTSLGFHKSAGQWYTPKGKRFTMSMAVDSSTTDVVSTFDIAAKALTAFGIKTVVDAIPGAETGPYYWDNEADMSWETMNSLDPLTEFANRLGTDAEFAPYGTYKGAVGMGFGPKVKVPGLGTVDVPQKITAESASVAPGPEMKKLTWDWARLVNEDVPYLQWQNKEYQLSYSTKHFVHWPAAKSHLWQTTGYNVGGGLVLMMEGGYIRPRS